MVKVFDLWTIASSLGEIMYEVMPEIQQACGDKSPASWEGTSILDNAPYADI